MSGAFYEQIGSGAYLASPATAGPWSPDAQHGGPPSALAAHALELHEPDERQRLARVAIDILRPIPIGKLTIRARTVRPGRKVSLVEAVMEADGREVLHARGWRLERRREGISPFESAGLPPPLPDTEVTSDAVPAIFSRASREGYLSHIEWRWLSSGVGPGARGRAWARPRIPLLPGEDASAMARTLLVADSGSGVGAVLSFSTHLFINVDLTVSLPRDPVGDWLLLDAATSIGPDGSGLTRTTLWDRDGAFGQGLQTLMIAPV